MKVASEVLMPRLSDTMEAGVLLRWRVSQGDAVAPGTPLADVETDKVTMTIEAEVTGFVEGLHAEEGASVPPGARLAMITTEAPTVEVGQASTSAASAGPTSEAFKEHESRPLGATTAPPERPRDPTTERIRATPLARRIARAHGVTLEPGTLGAGPSGRLLRQDVERLLRPSQATHSAPDERPDAPPPSSIHAVMAKRMTAAKRDIPHFYMSIEVDFTELLELRAEATAVIGPVSITALMVRAVAMTLVDHPRVNSRWEEGRVIRRPTVDIGLAVSLPDDGLIVPIITEANTRSLAETAFAVRDLAERARTRDVRPNEVAPSSLTISNLGTQGIDAFLAIINPPESAILAVGAVRQRAVVRDASVIPRAIAVLSLSADHRVMAGAAAAAFMAEVQQRIERPLALFL